MTEVEFDDSLALIRGAESRFLATVVGLADGDLNAASLCRGWTRGHVIAHVALNAHSLVNLMEWARTGTEIPQYPGWAERDADIQRYSTRSRDHHLDALALGATSFQEAARALPLDRWNFEVSGIGGQPQPVANFLFARLREVEIHHVDLDAGYGSADWSEGLIRRLLEDVPARLSPKAEIPFAVHAPDLDLNLAIGDGPPRADVSGAGHMLLLWLLGRSNGDELDTDTQLPPLPPWG